ncbi:hypothetical protein LSAT2_010563 [Lamellibrachia satsuma]|nr:hypothetical protein LSAT2_010563 [Lamellibrachia satsuma]
MQRLSWLVVGFLALLVALVFFSIKSSDSFNKVPVPVLQDDECKKILAEKAFKKMTRRPRLIGSTVKLRALSGGQTHHLR